MNNMTPIVDDATARRRALEDAIVRAGGIVRFAKAMGVTLQAVTLWRKQRYVPLTRAVEIERLFNVPRETLVPADVAAALATPRSPSSDVL
jgi:hypothetical protein